MKNLLVAIDFSKNSIHALEYALTYANRYGSDVFMIWVDNFIGDDMLIERHDGPMRHESREMFNEILEKYRKKNPGGDLKFKLSRGKVFEEIGRYARKINAQLIFSGTHGVTGFEEYWIGSNAYRIVTHAPCPVITLRQNFEFGSKVNRILMPIDSTLQSSRKVFATADVAAAFEAEVHILEVHTSKLGSLRKQVERHLRTVTEHLEKQKVAYHVNEIETKNITQDTINYAIENEIDLVSIMTEQETTQANVFMGTFARQLINNCPVPVMSVRMT